LGSGVPIFVNSADQPRRGRAPSAVGVSALQSATRSVPIVFVAIPDPVGAGFVKSLARPGGNTTGFIAFEYAIAAKWLELLKEIAPSVTRAAVLRDPTIAAGIGQFAAIQAVGPIAMELSVVDLRDADAIEQDVVEFARSPNGGLIVTVGPFGANHPNVITTLADRYKLPAVYPFRYFVGVGGLISYGPDLVSQFRPAAGYVDRILKGQKPADLPVQAPTKYELVINMKTAKALGIEVPPTLLARADEVIE
jgi:putative tryptophan/tyrosine transport system substrate-binding protein